MDEKWNVLNRKGYLKIKIHIAVNIKTKEILALEEAITDEKVAHDSSKMLKKLVDDVLKAVPPDEKNIVKNLKLVLDDGAHDTNTNFFLDILIRMESRQE